MSLQIVLYTPKNPYLNQATQKYTCEIFLPKKNPGLVVSTVEGEWDGNSELLDH